MDLCKHIIQIVLSVLQNEFPRLLSHCKSMRESCLWLSLGKNRAEDKPNIVRCDVLVSKTAIKNVSSDTE